MQIIRGKLPGAKKIVVYGPEGIGKSTFAAQFPDPVFIDTEGSTKDMDVARLPEPSSWTMILEQVAEVIKTPNVCKTLIVDTADWAEMLCINSVCKKNQKSSIEEFGYGKGYTYIQEEFGKLLNLLTDVIKVGIDVVLTAHAKMRKFEQPDELGAYDRWEMKLSKGVAPMVKEWADMVLFCNYKTMVVNVDGQGAQKGKNKAQGGRRVMYTTHHSCWDAKNRYGLPDEVPFEYDAIRHIVEESADQAAPAKEERKTTPSTSQPRQEEAGSAANKSTQEPTKKEKAAPPVETKSGPINPPEVKVDERIPKALRDLMINNQVDEWDIQNVVAARGYFPADMAVADYPPDFISGVLVGAWDQVYPMIKEMKETDSLVFN
ncbi:ATP-binding protein [Lacrimispora sp.]|uniref:ATP-binding protein n=1 Tax=Lacrimispora sp. TaxID=2719234 RepID=UPI0028602120|nr:ATP-binding protein [Lacrimispora sp.]MDR7813356.1 ATP-binding protein [Lacrimispora sp.]